MNKFKSTSKLILGNTGTRVWFIVTAVLMTIFIVATILINGLLYDILSQFLGRKQAILDTTGERQYNTAFTTKDEARTNGEKVNEAIAEEGIVLLKNAGNALPIPADSRLSVFGKNSANIVTRGSGSAAGSATSNSYKISLYDSLRNANFTLNQSLVDFYESSASGSGRSESPALSAQSIVEELLTGETPWSSYVNNGIVSSFNTSDVALIVLSRIGGESWDLLRSMKPNAGVSEATDHYLQLDKNEEKLIEEVSKFGFSKVIVVLNVATSMEVDFIETNAGIDAALWIGATGDTGINALPRILKGEVNPSGKLPDIYAKDFKKDPTWVNFGANNYSDVANRDSTYIYAYVDYEEDIYVGYRYYETRGYEEKKANPSSTWYDDNVVYSFGHGLSYTTFNQTLVNKSALNGANITTAEIDVEVKVENTGNTAGRDTIQIYVTAPYEKNKIEKSHVVLAGFLKTDIIEKNESKTYTVKLNPYYFASYDYADKNSNSFKGYELDTGDYVIRLGKNSHEEYDSVTMKVNSNIKYENNPITTVKTKANVVNRYSDDSVNASDKELFDGTMSRSDFEGTFPAERTAEQKKLSSEMNTAINSTTHNNPTRYDPDEFPTQGAKANAELFRELIQADYDDPRWEELLDMLTIKEMTDLFNKGAFRTNDIDRLGIPLTIAADGPAGWADFIGIEATTSVYGITNYVCEPLMAATFNVERLKDFGLAIGDEALIGNARGDGLPYSGWYAPGVNLHRSPFGGRAGEYFSEDPFLTGKLAAEVIKGAKEKGVYTQLKHFAVNEQETFRTGICTWLTEQSLREIYLRCFEIAVIEGGSTGMMSSFNRIGSKWTGGDYRLLTQILRNEWGFRGMVISDYNTGSSLNPKQMIYAGGDLNLQSVNYVFNPSKSSAADNMILRKASKNILYTIVNSNAMNYKVKGYKMPLWQILFIVWDIILVVGLTTWGVFAIRKELKKEKLKQTD